MLAILGPLLAVLGRLGLKSCPNPSGRGAKGWSLRLVMLLLAPTALGPVLKFAIDVLFSYPVCISNTDFSDTLPDLCRKREREGGDRERDICSVSRPGLQHALKFHVIAGGAN